MADAPVKKKKSTKQRHQLYDSGKIKNRSCPKCGEGFLLAAHKDRRSCGKCKYVEAIVKEQNE
jgi:ubiquitin-small subunit ribosomal protein S27Ae